MAYTERVAASQPHHEAMALGGWLLPPTPRRMRSQVKCPVPQTCLSPKHAQEKACVALR